MTGHVGLLEGRLGDTGVVHASASTVRVRGPVAPYPVLNGSPEETIPLAACHDWSAACVRGPKCQDNASLARYPLDMRKHCSSFTSGHDEPTMRKRVIIWAHPPDVLLGVK